MSHMLLTRRTILSAIPAALGARAFAAGDDAGTRPARSAAEAKIKDLEQYYARTYGEPLSSPERLPKQIAIVSLSRIDAADTTQRLLDVFGPRDRDPIVWHLAWEALHARAGSMTAAQRQRWLIGGLQAAGVGGFPGATVTPLLNALTELHPTAYEDQPHKVAARVVQENALNDPRQKVALDALRRLVAAWHDPVFVRALIGLATKPHLAPRVDHVLRGLPDPPAEAEPPKLAAAWTGWLAKSGLKAVAVGDLVPYGGKAGVFPAAERITDPSDKRWQAELEMGKLTVSDFDLVWCVDSTGSMNDENQMVAAETGNVVRVCAMVSRRARCGAVYARHEIDKPHLQKCCQAAASNPSFYQVKGYPLTADTKALAAKMAAERIPKPDKNAGNTHPGTPVLGALQGAVLQMGWSKDKNARRVIVMVGDSPLTPGTEKECESFAGECKRDGFHLHALTVGKATAEWAGVFRAAGGKIMPIDGKDSSAGGRLRKKLTKRPGTTPGTPAGGAGADAPRAVFGRLAVEIIRACVTPAYHDRVDPLVGILIDFATAAGEAEQVVAAAPSAR